MHMLQLVGGSVGHCVDALWRRSIIPFMGHKHKYRTKCFSDCCCMTPVSILGRDVLAALIRKNGGLLHLPVSEPNIFNYSIA